MNRDLPKWLQVTLLVLVALLALMMFTQRDKLHVYSAYFRETSPEVQLRLAELSPLMDEAAVRKHFSNVQMSCVVQAGDLGDRVCYGSIDRADGLSAMTLALFFKNGKLVRSIVQFPWWSHKSWLRSLKSRYGTPGHGGSMGGGGGPVLRWKTENGTLEMNRDRSLNPLAWSVMLWTAAP